jgi:hypothetical protein
MTIETLAKQTVEIAEADLAERILTHVELAEQANNHPVVRSTADIKGYESAAHELMEIHTALVDDDNTLTTHQHIRALLTAGTLWGHAGSNIGQRDAARAILDYFDGKGQPRPEHMQSYREIRKLFEPPEPPRNLLQVVGIHRRR